MICAGSICFIGTTQCLAFFQNDSAESICHIYIVVPTGLVLVAHFLSHVFFFYSLGFEFNKIELIRQDLTSISVRIRYGALIRKIHALTP